MVTKIDERIEEEYEAKIIGKFKIYLGDELYAKGKNKWTRYFVSSIIQTILTSLKSVGAHCNYDTHTGCSRGFSGSYTARAGNDTSTPSNPDMADLVSKIDIAPNTKNVVLFKSSGYTEYKSRHKFVWNAGTIPAQIIGEFGVYLYLSDDSWESPAVNPNFGTFIGYSNYTHTAVPWDNAGVRLGARISSADGDFDPIDYDSSEALILEWYVTIKF